MESFEQQFQQVFEYLPRGLLILDPDGCILNANYTALQILQKQGGLEAKAHLSDFLCPADEFLQSFEKLVAGRKQATFQIQSQYCIQKGIGQGWVQLEASYFCSSSNTPFIFVILEEVTSKIQGEQRLIQERESALRATRVKSDFLANVSHEIRTPIQTIMGMSELLLGTELDVEQREYTSQVQFAADILQSLVNDVLDLSKIEAGRLHLEFIAFDIYQLMEDAVDMISLAAYRKGIELVLQFDLRVPEMLVGDPMRVRQVAINFLSNALKFTHSGVICLGIEYVQTLDDGIQVKLYVEDTGIGIPAEKQDSVFHAFEQLDSSTTRKYGGTGLGLSISKNLVQMMRGNVGVESQEGKGSRFWFSIPFQTVDADSIHADTASIRAVVPEFEGKRVLVVDDSQKSCDVLCTYFRDWGMDAQSVLDGDDAVSCLRAAAEQDQPFDVVLIDLLLDSMDGWKVGGEINADTLINSARLILMVPNGQIGADAKMKRLGWFNDYITKPIRVRTLLSRVRSALAEDVDLPSLEVVEEVKDDSVAEGYAQFDGRVLLVEDHIVNQEMFAVILSHAGLAVETAENGQEAVELFKTKRFDIVFMDIQMPVMNGYEAARLIRQIDDRVPIIGVTANAQSGEKEKCEAAGMNDYVSKPFKARDIFPFLHRYVSGKEQLESEEIAFNYEGALESFMGKKDVLHRVLDAFCQRGIEQLQRLQDYVHSGQLDDARILAHGIKGGAAHLEAQELAQAASVVEDACIDDQKKRAQLGLQSLISAFDRFSHYAKEILLKK